MILLYTGAGNVTDDIVTDIALKAFFFKKFLFCLYVYMCKCN